MQLVVWHRHSTASGPANPKMTTCSHLTTDFACNVGNCSPPLNKFKRFDNGINNNGGKICIFTQRCSFEFRGSDNSFVGISQAKEYHFKIAEMMQIIMTFDNLLHV